VGRCELDKGEKINLTTKVNIFFKETLTFLL